MVVNTSDRGRMRTGMCWRILKTSSGGSLGVCYRLNCLLEMPHAPRSIAGVDLPRYISWTFGSIRQWKPSVSHMMEICPIIGTWRSAVEQGNHAEKKKSQVEWIDDHVILLSAKLKHDLEQSGGQTLVMTWNTYLRMFDFILISVFVRYLAMPPHTESWLTYSRSSGNSLKGC